MKDLLTFAVGESGGYIGDYLHFGRRDLRYKRVDVSKELAMAITATFGKSMGNKDFVCIAAYEETKVRSFVSSHDDTFTLYVVWKE